MICPLCGMKDPEDSGGIFYERGEFVNGGYEEEGSVYTKKCESCGAEFAILNYGRHENMAKRHDPMLCSITIMDEDLSEFIRQYRDWISSDAVEKAIAEDLGFVGYLKSMSLKVRRRILDDMASMIVTIQGESEERQDG